MTFKQKVWTFNIILIILFVWLGVKSDTSWGMTLLMYFYTGYTANGFIMNHVLTRIED